MLLCKKLRRHQPSSGQAVYVHPEGLARHRGALHVLEARAVKSTDTEGNEYTAYVVRCSYMEDSGRVSWEVRRRYADFFTLNSKLKRYGAVVAELPSRNPFGKMSSVVRSREVGLQAYLQAVLSHCNDKQCNYLVKFLQVQKHLPSYSERVQSSEHGAARSSMKREQGHRAIDGVDDDGERGRSTARDSGHVRAKSVPGVFGKRARPLVEGVPRSSLFARDDSSADFSRLFSRGGGWKSCRTHDDTSSDEEDAQRNFEKWNATRIRRQTRVAEVLECGECGQGADVALTGPPRREQMSESIARQQLKILEQLRQKREKQAWDATADATDASASGTAHQQDIEMAGIGLFFLQRRDGACVVDEMIAGGAAEWSRRIHVGDVLLCVDGQSVERLDLPSIRNLIVGRPGTRVNLEFSRRMGGASAMVHGFGESSDEDERTGEECVMVVRHRQGGGARGEAKGSVDEEEMEKYFVVSLVRGVPMAASGGMSDTTQMEGGVAGVAAEEGPSPLCQSQSQRLPGSGAPAARKLTLSLPASRGGEGARNEGGARAGDDEGCAAAAVVEMDGKDCCIERKLVALKTVSLADDGAAKMESEEQEGEGGGREDLCDRGSNSSSTQSLSYRSTVVANLSGRLSSSGEDTPSTPNTVSTRSKLGASAKHGHDAAGVAAASVDEVCQWLKKIDMEEFADTFRENKIDGEMLQLLDEGDLEIDFGMVNKYHRRRLLTKRSSMALSTVSALATSD